MIYDAVARAQTIVEANFGSKMLALAQAKEIEGDVAVTATVYPWLDALEIAGSDKAQPGIGVYTSSARTNAKRQTVRDSLVRMTLDYYARSDDPLKLERQCSLAAEALLQCVDLMGDDATGTFGAGEASYDVTVDFERRAASEGQRWYEERVIVTYTQQERDQGL